MSSNKSKGDPRTSHNRSSLHQGSDRPKPASDLESRLQEEYQDIHPTGNTWGQGGLQVLGRKTEHAKGRQSQVTEWQASTLHSHPNYSTQSRLDINNPHGQTGAMISSPMQYSQAYAPNDQRSYTFTSGPNALVPVPDPYPFLPRISEQSGGIPNPIRSPSGYLDPYTMSVTSPRAAGPIEEDPFQYNGSYPAQYQGQRYSQLPAGNNGLIRTQESDYITPGGTQYHGDCYDGGSYGPSHQGRATRPEATDAQYGQRKTSSQKETTPSSTHSQRQRYPPSLGPRITLSPVEESGMTAPWYSTPTSTMGNESGRDPSFSEESPQGRLRAPRSRDRQHKDGSRPRVLTPQGREDAKIVRRNRACKACHNSHKKCVHALYQNTQSQQPAGAEIANCSTSSSRSRSVQANYDPLSHNAHLSSSQAAGDYFAHAPSPQPPYKDPDPYGEPYDLPWG